MEDFAFNRSHVIFDVMCDHHLCIFYPLPYFQLEAINNVLSTANDTIPNSSKYLDVTFHWITLDQIADDDFAVNFLTAFDFQILANNA